MTRFFYGKFISLFNKVYFQCGIEKRLCYFRLQIQREKLLSSFSLCMYCKQNKTTIAYLIFLLILILELHQFVCQQFHRF